MVASYTPEKRKTRILTSTNGISPIQAIPTTNPNLAHDITSAIITYSTKPNEQNPLQHDPVELTDIFRLLGLPVGNKEFTTTAFLNKQLEAIQNQTKKVNKVIKDPHTLLRLFQQCTSMKLSHLLVTDPLHNHPADTIYTEDRQIDIHQLPRPIHLGHKRSHIQLYRRPHQTIQPHY